MSEWEVREYVETVLRLAAAADVLVEGMRPGVAERLGVGPQQCRARHPALVYARMTGWGQDGPLAQAPGHDINYAGLVGAVHATGSADKPRQALNLVADFGGGSLFLVVGILAALLERQRSGHGQVVDAAMVDGATSLLTMVYGPHADGVWTDRREENLLDGGAPFYDTYRCADGKHVAVGALEPQFYAALLDGLGLSFDTDQLDRTGWPAQREALTRAFATRTRDEWCDHFSGRNACVSPVLGLDEAPHHPHLQARRTFTAKRDGYEPVAAPASPVHRGTNRQGWLPLPGPRHSYALLASPMTRLPRCSAITPEALCRLRPLTKGGTEFVFSGPTGIRSPDLVVAKARRRELA